MINKVFSMVCKLFLGEKTIVMMDNEKISHRRFYRPVHLVFRGTNNEFSHNIVRGGFRYSLVTKQSQEGNTICSCTIIF